MIQKRKRKRGGAIEGMPAYPRRLDRPGKVGLLRTEASDPGEVEPKIGDGAAYKIARASGGRLTAGERDAMPSSEFALPGKGSGSSGKGSGSYPIGDAKHARLALAMDHNASPEERKTIERKVHERYPGIGKN